MSAPTFPFSYHIPLRNSCRHRGKRPRLSDHVDDGVNATKDSSGEYDDDPEENEGEDGFPYCAPVTIA